MQQVTYSYGEGVLAPIPAAARTWYEPISVSDRTPAEGHAPARDTIPVVPRDWNTSAYEQGSVAAIVRERERVRVG